MVAIEDVRRLAQDLPRSYEVLVRDRVKFRVGRIVWLAFSHDETLMGFAFPKEEREILIESEPHKFMMPKPSDQRYNWVVVKLSELDRTELREIVHEAWRMVVPKSVAAEHLGDRSSPYNRAMKSLEEFYYDVLRRDSRERRFGSRWSSERDPQAVFSVFWLADTGEVCALRAPRDDVKIGGGPTNLLSPGGMIWANAQAPAAAGLSVSVLGLVDDEDRLDAVLVGWERHEGEPDGIEWVKGSLDPRA